MEIFYISKYGQKNAECGDSHWKQDAISWENLVFFLKNQVSSPHYCSYI